jgi:hypothetical protein
MIRSSVVACVCGSIFCATVAAGADSVDIAYRYVDAGGTPSVYLDGIHHYGPPAGMLAVTTSNPVGALASQMSITSWVSCSGELSQSTTFATSTYSVDLLVDVVGDPKADLIGQLWGEHYDYAWNATTPIYHGGAYSGYWPGEPAPTADNINALSLSLSLWEIMYDFDGTLASLDLGTGRFRMSASSDSDPATFANVQGWLGSLVLPNQYQGPLPQLVYLTSRTQQDLIGEVVPEPATLLLLAMGGLTLRRRRA